MVYALVGAILEYYTLSHFYTIALLNVSMLKANISRSFMSTRLTAQGLEVDKGMAMVCDERVRVQGLGFRI